LTVNFKLDVRSIRGFIGVRRCVGFLSQNKKIELLKECVKTLEKPKVDKWYRENFQNKPQRNTIDSLVSGISEGKLTVREALEICLIVGVQWSVNFEKQE